MSAFLCQGIRNAGSAVKGIRYFLKGCICVWEKDWFRVNAFSKHSLQ